MNYRMRMERVTNFANVNFSDDWWSDDGDGVGSSDNFLNFPIISGRLETDGNKEAGLTLSLRIHQGSLNSICGKSFIGSDALSPDSDVKQERVLLIDNHHRITVTIDRVSVMDVGQDIDSELIRQTESTVAQSQQSFSVFSDISDAINDSPISSLEAAIADSLSNVEEDNDISESYQFPDEMDFSNDSLSDFRFLSSHGQDSSIADHNCSNATTPASIDSGDVYDTSLPFTAAAIDIDNPLEDFENLEGVFSKADDLHWLSDCKLFPEDVIHDLPDLSEYITELDNNTYVVEKEEDVDYLETFVEAQGGLAGLTGKKRKFSNTQQDQNEPCTAALTEGTSGAVAVSALGTKDNNHENMDKNKKKKTNRYLLRRENLAVPQQTSAAVGMANLSREEWTRIFKFSEKTSTFNSEHEGAAGEPPESIRYEDKEAARGQKSTKKVALVDCQLFDIVRCVMSSGDIRSGYSKPFWRQFIGKKKFKGRSAGTLVMTWSLLLQNKGTKYTGMLQSILKAIGFSQENASAFLSFTLGKSTMTSCGDKDEDYKFNLTAEEPLGMRSIAAYVQEQWRGN